MPFVEAARQRARQLPAGDPTRVILEYMLDHAVGVQNAKSWNAIQAELHENDIRLSKEQFQQTILAETRRGEIWIGSTDHGHRRGYFFIQDHGDAMTARNFYRRAHTRTAGQP